jgi:hypothetical protein
LKALDPVQTSVILGRSTGALVGLFASHSDDTADTLGNGGFLSNDKVLDVVGLGNVTVERSQKLTITHGGQILSHATTYGRNHGKAIYAFSVDREAGKIAHANYVPKDILAEKKIDGKKWLAEVSKVLGGKVSPDTMS